MAALWVRAPEQDTDIQTAVHRAVEHVEDAPRGLGKRKSGAKKATVNQTLWRASSIASPIRSNAGTPSTSGRTRFPGRTGYAPEATNGMCD
jgi:hypothetical protein